MGRPITTTAKFIEKAKKVHGDKYYYDNSIYEGALLKVTITCKKHGDFFQIANMHLRGQGCPKCVKNFRKNTDIVEKFLDVHKDTYDYSKYVHKDMHTKSIIICREHGEFEQNANNHLHLKQGCPKCGKESHWIKSNYIRKAKGKICTFYTLRCFNEQEEFYKIGITMNSVKKRYNHISHMPYNYEIISEIHGEAGFIWNLELENKRKLKEFHYIPQMKFDGSKTECFTKIKM